MSSDGDSLKSIEAALTKQAGDTTATSDKWSKLPPLHLWNPPLSGKMELCINKEGEWIYKGDPLKRQKVVKLFSRILKREGDEYFLVTPVEKWQIDVEDTPWLIVRADVNLNDQGKQVVRCVTNLDDTVEISASHPLEMRPYDNQAAPYVLVRANLYARVNRSTLYDMTNHIEENEDGVFGLRSHNEFFPLAES
jgi:hypothetical protein